MEDENKEKSEIKFYSPLPFFPAVLPWAILWEGTNILWTELRNGDVLLGACIISIVGLSPVGPVSDLTGKQADQGAES